MQLMVMQLASGGSNQITASSAAVCTVSQVCIAFWYELAYALCIRHFVTQTVAPRPATLASPENLLEMETLNLHFRLTESESVF